MGARRTREELQAAAERMGMILEDSTETLPMDKEQRRARKRASSQNLRPFIMWDGEGVDGRDDAPQNYVLFGHSEHDHIVADSLSTRDCLNFLLGTAELHPGAIHAAFAFDYDVNMILKDLAPWQFDRLRSTGHVWWGNFKIEHIPSKWFSVTEYWPRDDQGVRAKRRHIRVSDLFGFFQCSFIKACKSYLTADHEAMINFDTVIAGKGKRNAFTMEDLSMIIEYWTSEMIMLKALADQLRVYMLEAGFKINAWHGPGALASFVYRTNHIQDHKAVCPDDVNTAAQYAYAGGRFELFRMGRHRGPVYSLDINSAYPAAIAELPSLSEGVWIHRGPEADWTRPDVPQFALWHVVYGVPIGKIDPAPAFWRGPKGDIYYPNNSRGWYWTPELIMIAAASPLVILECWEYVGWKTQPFKGFVNDYYDRRKVAKREGLGYEKAIKLALNSLYGKMAQRVGWERTGGPPPWHQLEWAGWVTSWARARLYSVLRRIPWEDQIAVETDGIYTTASPDDLGVRDSKELGGWEVNEYDEVMYLQSGIYGLHTKGVGWTTKYRGLDQGTLSADAMASYLRSCQPGEPWSPITGSTTRFNGYQYCVNRAHKNDDRFNALHRRWATDPEHSISIGNVGKRQHFAKSCPACKSGQTAYEQPHDLRLPMAAYMAKQNLADRHHSHPHYLPWKESSEPAHTWRDTENDLVGLLA